MAKRRKKSLSQVAVGAATSGMPSGVKKLVTSRIGAPLIVILGVALIGTGVLKVNFSGGRPQLSVDRERAQEVRGEVSELAQTVGDEIQDNKKSDGAFFERHEPTVLQEVAAPFNRPGTKERPFDLPDFGGQPQGHQRPGKELGNRISNLKDRILDR